MANKIFVGLLRAVNVGGQTLLMKDLVKLCEKAGFTDARTFIQSGNVVFGSKLTEEKTKATLEAALEKHTGKPVDVIMRTAEELAAALKANPFKQHPPNRVIVLFLNEPPATVTFATPGGEEVVVKGRDVFIYYPAGQGVSKLRLPYAKVGTGRNVNTVNKLLALATSDSKTDGSR